MTQTSFDKNAIEQFGRTLIGRFVSRRRRRIRFLVVAFTVPSVLLITLGFNSHSQNQTTQPRGKLTAAQKAQIPELENVSVNIRRVSEILNADGVRIEAGLLFTPNGRKKARPQLEAYSDMYLSKTHTGPLRGVLMADTLTLPEKAKIDGDTVIIAKHIVFTGRAPVIKGNHEIHVFALESTKAANGPKTVITIDTSGRGRDEWIKARLEQANAKRTKRFANHAINFQDTSGAPGADGVMGPVGSNGENGSNGLGGANGSCSTSKNGGTGFPGGSAFPGGDGGPGTHATKGENAHNQSLIVNSVNSGSYNVVARGGKEVMVVQVDMAAWEDEAVLAAEAAMVQAVIATLVASARAAMEGTAAARCWWQRRPGRQWC